MTLDYSEYAVIPLILIFSNLICMQFGLANDTLVPSEGISIGETLTSAGQNFELGFFNPHNSTRRYVGIWYKKTPEMIVWVANRENPLVDSDQSVKLILNEEGNLRLLDGKQAPVWSTNLSLPLNNSIATLYDTGNFILKDNKTNNIAWESFNQSSDVALSSMSYQINTQDGAEVIMNSWRSANNPSSGNFTLVIIPQVPVQSYIQKGSTIYWRTGPWNGVTFVGIPDLSTAYTDTFSVHVDAQAGILYLSWNNIYDKLSARIMKLFPDGSLKSLDLRGDEWHVAFAAPDSVCDVYMSCGRFAVCNPNESPKCGCLRGFVPKIAEEWRKGNWTNGCIRRTELLCSNNATGNSNVKGSENDGFLKLSTMKLPDVYYYLADENDEGCQNWCLANCSCSAFAYVNGIGCLVWSDDLIDLQKFSSSGEDLFVRLAHSELVESNRRTFIIAMISTSVFVVSLSIYVFWRCKTKNKENSSNDSEESALKNSSEKVETEELPAFEFEMIAAATNGFSKMNKIGEGGFGQVFKGKLQSGEEIAVKRLSSQTGQGINEFKNEILLISKLQHRNLVKIFGCSVKGEEKLIIYEYLANRSLDTFLFDPVKKKQLGWAVKFSIIQNVARGLSYLHKDSRLRVIHRDVKASNILLDHDMNPKISDFGLARSFQAAQESANTLRVVGTFGYMSPEYAMRGIFSEKSDVFSFGVLMLEMISGKKISSYSYSEQDQSLPTYAWTLWNEGRGLELMDKATMEVYTDTQVLRCVNVGLLCIQDHADDRPTMSNVVVMLSSSDTALPLPKKPTFDPEFRSRSSENGSVYSVNGVTASVVEVFAGKQRGFKNLYTLKGGVSHYLEKEGSKAWVGNLFVFDSRLSLPPSTFKPGFDQANESIELASKNKLARFYVCGSQIHDLRHRNCASIDCSLLFLSCPNCMEELRGCCSSTCTCAPRLRPLLHATATKKASLPRRYPGGKPK